MDILIQILAMAVVGILLLAISIPVMYWAMLAQEKELANYRDLLPEPEPMPALPKSNLEKLADMERGVADLLGFEASDRSRYTFVFEAPEGHDRAFSFKVKSLARGQFSITWQARLRDAPESSWTKDEQQSWWQREGLRSNYLESEQRRFFPLEPDSPAQLVRLEKLALVQSALEIELHASDEFDAAAILTSLLAITEDAERDEDALVAKLLDILSDDAEDEDRILVCFDWLTAHHETLLLVLEEQRAEALVERLVRIEQRLTRTLAAVEYPDRFDERERVSLLVDIARSKPEADIATRAMERIADHERRPEDWLDLLALHATSGALDHSSGQWLERLLLEAPNARQTLDAADKVMELIWKTEESESPGWDGYLGEDASVREALVKVIERLIAQPSMLMPQFYRLLAAIDLGMQPEMYIRALEHIAQRTNMLSPTKEKWMLLALCDALTEKLESSRQNELLLEPLARIARLSEDPEVQKRAYRVHIEPPIANASGAREALVDLLEHIESTDDFIYMWAAKLAIETARTTDGEVPEGVVALLEAIIIVAKTRELFDGALAAYPQTSPHHHNFLLSVEAIPRRLFEALLADISRQDNRDVYAPGLRAVLLQSQNEERLWGVLDLIFDKNLGPYGRALKAMAENRALSSRVRQRSEKLLERWRAENAHLMGSLSVSENSAAGALSLSRGEKGGLSLEEK